MIGFGLEQAHGRRVAAEEVGGERAHAVQSDRQVGLLVRTNPRQRGSAQPTRFPGQVAIGGLVAANTPNL
jgi:hypothetical protein